MHVDLLSPDRAAEISVALSGLNHFIFNFTNDLGYFLSPLRGCLALPE
jgi:hypothetical protein